MTTTITPSLGAGAPFTQLGRGTSPGYDAIDFRRATLPGVQEGAIESGAYDVTQRGSGANMSVDIAASAGSCVVQGDHVTGQGVYVVPPHSVTINEVIATADATNPRIDQVILEIKDDTHDASGLNEVRIRVLTGTATAGATLDTRTGAASLPSSAMLLADVLVAAADTSITNSEIRDRRPWARGAYWRTELTTGGNYTTSITSMAAIDSTNLNPRIECSGVPVEITLSARVQQSTSGVAAFELRTDGTAIGDELAVGTQEAGATLLRTPVPSAGSHKFAWYWRASANSATILRAAGNPVQVTVHEVVAQNASND